MINIKNLLLVAFCFSNTAIFAQHQYILSLSKGEKKLVVMDYTTLEVIKKIPVGDDPHEIVTNSDGTRAYISVPLMNAGGHEINVINLQTLEPERTINTSPFSIPHGLAFRNDSLWYTAQGSKNVVVYDLKQNRAVKALGTGQDFTHLIYLTKNGKTFYTTNVESGTLSIYENKEIPPYMPPTGILPANAKPRNDWRQTLVDVGLGAEGFDVSPDEKELWTARPDGTIVIVDLEKKQVKHKINTQVKGLHRLKITQDGKTVCIVSVKTGDLLFYNRKTLKLEKRMQVGQGAGIYMDSNNRIFISCTPNNYVAVIDLLTQKEIKRLPMERPDGITSVITP
ncbi:MULTISPECIES: YncE family protein [Sphingobacterium]|uniref:DNA-binding beta-propeller fold protein YncE n=1 Tax=Sphingobacterium siyangense TaxID=459529 RepID=A0A562MBZ4_9SPHI|nr:YncE family protein [Sphingobacterium siyangense]TWI17410.1 DNA-binding beta-propeller fold protein YncE [Sphingobacterium siyangense]